MKRIRMKAALSHANHSLINAAGTKARRHDNRMLHGGMVLRAKRRPRH